MLSFWHFPSPSVFYLLFAIAHKPTLKVSFTSGLSYLTSSFTVDRATWLASVGPLIVSFRQNGTEADNDPTRVATRAIKTLILVTKEVIVVS